MKLSKILIGLLIIFFIYIIVNQIFFSKNTIFEGLANSTADQYQSYNTSDPNNSGVLAQQNAGNIQVLEKQVNTLSELQPQVKDMSNNLVTISKQLNALQQQVSALTTQQQTAANSVSQKLSASSTSKTKS